MISQLLTQLLFKSEGTDIDFKSAQYRFSGAKDEEKAEMLKDILAMANAWRDGPGYILLGFREQRPQPAEVVGISDSIDDAKIQQFVHGKVRPHLQFTYEEHSFQGKTVGVITIPTQRRVFYLEHDYVKLRRNVVYIRRGSSTAEATPQEVATMVATDAGRGNPRIKLSVFGPNGQELPETIERAFPRFEPQLPDFQRRMHGLASLGANSLSETNTEFWRDLGRFHQLLLGGLQIQFALANESDFQLTNVKLEVTVVPSGEVRGRLFTGAGMPPRPKRDISMLKHTMADLVKASTSNPHGQTVIVNHGQGPVADIRFASLLPGELCSAADYLWITLDRPGHLALKLKILAAELPEPIQIDRGIEVTGNVVQMSLDELQAYDKHWMAGGSRTA